MNQDQNPYQFPDSMNPQGSRTGTSIGALLGKTYALLAATLVVSAIAAVYGMSSPFAYEHPFILMIGSFALLFAVQYTGAHRSPFAIPLVFLFAAGMGMMMGPAIEMYLRMPNGATVIAEALGTTAAMFIGLSAYAMTTRRDFSAGSRPVPGHHQPVHGPAGNFWRRQPKLNSFVPLSVRHLQGVTDVAATTCPALSSAQYEY